MEECNLSGFAAKFASPTGSQTLTQVRDPAIHTGTSAINAEASEQPRQGKATSFAFWASLMLYAHSETNALEESLTRLRLNTGATGAACQAWAAHDTNESLECNFLCACEGDLPSSGRRSSHDGTHASVARGSSWQRAPP